VDKEISEMKLFVSDTVHGPDGSMLTDPQLNARARFVAESFLTPVSDPAQADPAAPTDFSPVRLRYIMTWNRRSS